MVNLLVRMGFELRYVVRCPQTLPIWHKFRMWGYFLDFFPVINNLIIFLIIVDRIKEFY